MSAGMTVIGSDSPGIQNIIENGVNGVVCKTDANSIRNTINDLLKNPELCKSLGKYAYKYVLENNSLDKILDLEYQMYSDLYKNKI